MKHDICAACQLWLLCLRHRNCHRNKSDLGLAALEVAVLQVAQSALQQQRDATQEEHPHAPHGAWKPASAQSWQVPAKAPSIEH